jgi:hypothetical protein
MAKKDYGLGRVYKPDPRDKMFLMARKLAPAHKVAVPTSKLWAIGSVHLDQGDTGTCVGHGWKNFSRCAPLQVTAKNAPGPFDIYRKAVLLDEWPENDGEATAPESDLQGGTSVRAGAKAMTQFGRLKSYLWAFDLQTMLQFLLTRGPVVLGTNWYDSMFDTDKNGIVKITPQAQIAGGHCYLARGADTKRMLIRFCNSWSNGWGKGGDAYMSFADAERLIHEEGEACTAVEQKLVAK